MDGKDDTICRELYTNLDMSGHTFPVSIFYFLFNFLKKLLAKKNIVFPKLLFRFLLVFLQFR